MTEWSEEVEGMEDLEEILPLLGHRNWIQIADMAFPALSSEGVQTVWLDEELLPVLDFVLEALGDLEHVRPVVWLDEELDFVQEGWAPGITEFREELYVKLHGLPINRLPHEQLIAKLNEIGQKFQILVVKTSTCLPYTSVFLELDCAYWDEEREQALRLAMGARL